MIYKERIVELREERFIKQYELANILEIHKGLYNQYECETTLIPTKHLNTLCNFFNVSFDYIFGFNKILSYENSKEEIDKITSGNRLKEFRKENKLTQDKLSKILNVSRTTITEYERGTNIIATPFLYTICNKYNISADYLLGKIDEPRDLTFINMKR